MTSEEPILDNKELSAKILALEQRIARLEKQKTRGTSK
jgi:uncharacterized small protein (DUF1192 family)